MTKIEIPEGADPDFEFGPPPAIRKMPIVTDSIDHLGIDGPALLVLGVSEEEPPMRQIGSILSADIHVRAGVLGYWCGWRLFYATEDDPRTLIGLPLDDQLRPLDQNRAVMWAIAFLATYQIHRKSEFDELLAGLDI